MGKAQSIIDFLFSVSRGEMIDVVREALTLIAQNADPLAADEMLIELSGKTRISEVTLREEFRKHRSKTFKEERKVAGPLAFRGSSEEYLLLSAVIHFPKKLDYVMSRLDMKDIRDRTVASLFQKISAAVDKDALGAVLDDAVEEGRILYTKLSVEPGFDTEHVDRIIEDCLMTIERKKMEEKLRLATLTGDPKLSNARVLEKIKRIEEKKL
jgi:hypothetical protein